MKPVDQEFLRSADMDPPIYGDCLRACVASVLELPLADVPNFHWQVYPGASDTDPQDVLVDRWLAGRGLATVRVYGDPDEMFFNGSGPKYVVAWGTSPRNPKGDHAVVCKIGDWGFDFVHDPHPTDKRGVVDGYRGFMFIVKEPK